MSDSRSSLGTLVFWLVLTNLDAGSVSEFGFEFELELLELLELLLRLELELERCGGFTLDVGEEEIGFGT